MRTISQHKNTVAVLAVLLIGFFVWTLTAGDLNPPGVPSGTMRTLNEIYAAAFNRDPEFYSFYRSLEAYKNSLGTKGDLLVIGPDSDFLRYLKNADGGK